MSNQPRGGATRADAGANQDDEAKAKAEAEAKAKAEADEKAKQEAAAKAKAEAEAKAKASPVYTVAPGSSLTSLRGILGPGTEVGARDFSGGEDNLKQLVAAGLVVKS